MAFAGIAGASATVAARTDAIILFKNLFTFPYPFSSLTQIYQEKYIHPNGMESALRRWVTFNCKKKASGCWEEHPEAGLSN